MQEATNAGTDKASPKTTAPATEHATNLSQQVFADPHDFLKTIQDNFKEMAHGHDVISEADLTADMTSGSTDKIKAAATLAEKHFSDLDKITASPKDNPGISKDDIGYALI